LHGHGKGTAPGIAQDQGVDAGNAPLLENRKALTPSRVERMAYLYPSRNVDRRLCSSN
jgi:hypothetical protein